MSEQLPAVRIVAVPPGEAPLWVREAWVGLELPLVRYLSSRKFLCAGVLSGSRSRFGWLWDLLRGRTETITGYMIDAALAVDILCASSPAAAAWWRENTPDLLAPKRCFIFHADVCRMLPEGSI
ncbi:hypothetical protein [Niveispirillum cyanobacteriorum]|uniref:Uncharacterized protein n=1 Tax=Niveispirillum cyanobacteriorum TaxID=1612173 RepID=A0A2K9NGG2_9PROT|nr:hypothetical protein [Niveispirillum cyanobacteriorum]AUN32204.1 hypothetical protein C0V82_17520 [Niveispirillum cyanobacteriorum]GGE75163.1 hypothetical protein GCM10011317_35350 [Niveispirillum cyanobacteriorum]